MDNETITARALGRTYGINGDTLEKNYRNVLSDYKNWDQKDHAEEWVLKKENIGSHLGIDETSIGNDVYTILHNKAAHGKKGAVIAMVKGTKPDDVAKIINQIPLDEREKVSAVTMDLSDSMRAIITLSFPKAIVTRDCFHVIKNGGDGIEEIRLRLKREAVKIVKKKHAEFKKRLERLNKRRKAYRDKMKEKYGKKWRKSKRGRKPMRKNTRFTPSKLENGETLVEALTKCRKQLFKSRDKWSKHQEARAKILFKLYPKLEEAYNIINKLRSIFRSSSLTKETAKVKLDEWYKEVNACTLREIKAVRDTIKFYEDEILNYFIERDTNASAESLNSKIKCFRSELKGVNDVPFFMYRVVTVLG